MTQDKDEAGLELGVYGEHPETPVFGLGEIIASALSVIWIVVIGSVLMFGSRDGAVAWVLIASALLMPVALIWVIMLSLKTAKKLRDATVHFQGSIDALRHGQVLLNRTAGMGVKPPPTATKQPSARDPISTRPQSTPAAAPSDPQSNLEFEESTQPDPISVEDFIRALNFPNDENDREGFRALRQAFADPDAGKLIRASQDVLTLLSQEGIYTDDFTPDHAHPDLWRRFAQGERGQAVADLGGVRSPSALTKVTNRMRDDVVFRDATHHFLRYFDYALVAFVQTATDQDIADLSQTRTARAFMLLGRASGTFDG